MKLDKRIEVALLEAFDAMVVVTPQGQPCYRSGNGLPMGMPKRVERKVRAALRSLGSDEAMTHDAERAEAIKQRLHAIPGGFSPNDLARELVASWAAVREEARDTKVGVTAVIRDAAGRVLLGRKGRSFSPEFSGKWVTPGGRVGHGERLLDALAREVREETALEVTLRRALSPQELIHPRGHYVFFAWEVEAIGPDAARAGDDLIEIRWFTPDEAEAILTDATALTAVLVRESVTAGQPNAAAVRDGGGASGASQEVYASAHI